VQATTRKKYELEIGPLGKWWIKNMEMVAQINLVHIAINHCPPSSVSVGRAEKATYRLESLVTARPLGGQVSKDNLEGEIDQDGQCEVLLPQSLLEELKRSRGVVGGGSKLGHEVDEDESLDV
jgi:hypothetical protein